MADQEFSRIVSVLAAEDPELVEHFRTKMFGDSSPETSDTEIEAMIRVQYDQDPTSYQLAVGRCVAGLAGVQLGSEVFHGEA